MVFLIKYRDEMKELTEGGPNYLTNILFKLTHLATRNLSFTASFADEVTLMALIEIMMFIIHFSSDSSVS